MPSDFFQEICTALRNWLREQAEDRSVWSTSRSLLGKLLEFVRDSTPEQRRSRYGDMDYDWEHRVDTTSGTVDWRERLLGLFHSPYQPTDPAAFREMMAALPIDFREFAFVDIGSGKGRTLLMASEYPFRKIIGVEIMTVLHRAAEANVTAYLARAAGAMLHPAHSDNPARIEAVCMDARNFVFPETPLLVYLFNPLPEMGLRRVIQNLEKSWTKTPRPVWIIYHNPVMELVMAESTLIERVIATSQYSVYRVSRDAIAAFISLQHGSGDPRVELTIGDRKIEAFWLGLAGRSGSGDGGLFCREG